MFDRPSSAWFVSLNVIRMRVKRLSTTASATGTITDAHEQVISD